MSTRVKIQQLFKKLPEDEKLPLLEELRKEVTSKVALVDNEPDSCPHCESKLFVKNGKRGLTQQYKCKSCNKAFTAKTGTAMHRLQKPDKFKMYQSLMLESYYPIKQIAKKVGVSIQTAFDWRHKILSGIKKDDKSFEGITEMDDIWFLYSQKGRRDLPHSRRRGGSTGAGDNNYQTKLLITTDRNKTTDMSVVRIGRLKKSDIERKVSGKFAENCTLVSDKHRSIAAFAKSEHLKHVNFKASKHTAGGEYHVQNINSMASRLKSIINGRLKGVSTKYLQNYANWYRISNETTDRKDIDKILRQNKEVASRHTNREGMYKWFIENFSKRTYRCPVKKTFHSVFDQETLIKLNLI